jgi:Cys-tRNA(Pro)/Cys-tRNA(Cys) deacylase
MAANGTPATAALRRAGIAHTLHEYEVAPSGVRDRVDRPAYGLAAAAALAVDPTRIFKTLVASLDGTLVLAIVPVAGELDLKRLADALRGRRVLMAEPAVAERATGYVVGGISPLGGRRKLRTALDLSADEHETVFVSAGRRGLQVELAPADLRLATGAVVAPIARR